MRSSHRSCLAAALALLVGDPAPEVAPGTPGRNFATRFVGCALRPPASAHGPRGPQGPWVPAWRRRAMALHDERDPVCGMMVNVDAAAWKTEVGGKAYVFCGESCLKTFVADPGRFLKILRRTRQVGDHVHELTANPIPRVGEAKFHIAAISAGKSVRIEGGIAEVYPLRRDVPPRPSRYELHPVGRDSWGFSADLPEAGTYRLRFELRLAGGATEKSAFDVAVEPAPPPEPEPDPAPADSFPMKRQHETMRWIGERWRRIAEALESGGRADAELRIVRRLAADLPRFQLHKLPERKAEFDTISGEMQRSLEELADLLARGDRAGARVKGREIETYSCVRCHLAFYWGNLTDVSRFPDLRRREHVWDK